MPEEYFSNPLAWAAFAPLVVLVGSLVNGLWGARLKEPLPGLLATIATGVAFLLSLVAFIALLAQPERASEVSLWPYLVAGELQLSLGFVLDQLSVLLMLVITGVGLLIHLYSVGYMHGDAGLSRYFSALNLFVAAMLILVMADSYLLMFVGWEGVGVCSYLLIGFWYAERLNADAARKAFIVNRIGDTGFLLAMFLGYRTFGTLDIAAMNQAAGNLAYGSAVLTAIGLLFLLAAAGKSAQLPLQVWLPDAMAGPTPVSALIHAATMVTAGVYLVARSAPLFAQAPDAAAAVAWIGGLTALVAAFAAMGQTDIKKILAYSTISQLGFMFAAAGAGAYTAAVFHLFTHAFFKALLFLGAGSVIHAMAGEQDVRKMGGLGRLMPVTGVTALVATLAIAGVPLLAGFFSKDAILAGVYGSEWLRDYGGMGLYVVLLVTAAMTAFYMFRWYYLVFAGRSRLATDVERRVHESPAVMTVPLAILALFSVAAGYLGLPEFAFPNWIGSWLEPAVGAEVAFLHPAAAVEWSLVALSIAAAGLGLGLAYWTYHLRSGRPGQRWGSGALGRLSREGAGFDALYNSTIKAAAEGTADGLGALDRDLLDRGVSGTGGLAGLLARASLGLQSGYVRTYAMTMLLGVLALVLLLILSSLFGSLPLQGVPS
ncbi:MAG: NADH-quinone oxidoreductase subunit L [Trueperaceae bacterium]